MFSAITIDGWKLRAHIIFKNIYNKNKFVQDKIITVIIIGFGVVKKRYKNLRSNKNSQHVKRFELAGTDG